jgi:hypothetical protein
MRDLILEKGDKRDAVLDFGILGVERALERHGLGLRLRQLFRQLGARLQR